MNAKMLFAFVLAKERSRLRDNGGSGFGYFETGLTNRWPIASELQPLQISFLYGTVGRPRLDLCLSRCRSALLPEARSSAPNFL
jgi:hypothetical protein